MAPCAAARLALPGDSSDAPRGVSNLPARREGKLRESIAGPERVLLHYRDPRGPTPTQPGPVRPEGSPGRCRNATAESVGSGLSMDAKQVWRAVLGELQVSLSPANFETWLKDTSLVDLDENRYRIAAPNGFARDWLDNRYRTLISQTLARVVGGSVQVEFVVP